MGLQEQFSHERAWSKGPGIADGADIEQAVLGTLSIPLRERRDEYLAYADAIEYAKKYQPSQLERSKIIKGLRQLVTELSEDTEHPVKFYTAVGTPLDIYHGIDAFFEQNGRRATIDISLKDKESLKADVLMKVSFDNDGRPELGTQEMHRVADEIARKLSTPLRRAA